MSDTLGSLRTELLSWLRGDLNTPADVSMVNAAINDAIEDIWMSMMRVQLARFFGTDSPVTFSLPVSTERVQLISISDPTIAIAANNQAGGNLPATPLLLYYTYVTESGSETKPSPVFNFNRLANNLTFIPPPPLPASGWAFGWNLYAGVVNPGLQNQQPLPMAYNFIEPATGFLDYPDAQQVPPISNTTADNISWITHLEVITSDTLRRAWNQYDIDSEIMRRYASTLSSASEYQGYVWDLINGTTFEVRPPTGSAFTPRYFYVAKPRRLRYDQAEIPYTSITGVHEFLINTAMARLKLALDEYLAQQAWSTAAEAGRLNIERSLTQENWAKNNRIAPYLA